MAAKKLFDFKLLFLSLLLLSAVNLFAAEPVPIIEDKADLLSDEEELQLYEVMMPIVEFGGVAFVTNKEGYAGEASDLANSYCKSFFQGASGVVFLIDLYNRRIEFYSTGEIYDIMGSMWSDIIADNVYQHATDEQYFICAQKAFSQIVTILRGGKVAAPMRYVSSVLLAIAITLLIMYFFLYSSRKKAKFGKKMQLLTEGVERELHIELVDKKLIRTQHITHSSGGGSRGGGSRGGGGGGSRGGGGGHGF